MGHDCGQSAGGGWGMIVCRRWVGHDCVQSAGGGWGMIVGRVQEVGGA